MLRLLDSVMKRPPVGRQGQGRLAERRAAPRPVSDADLEATCTSCNKRLPLSHYTISAGRETTYACPSCGSVMVMLASAEDGANQSPPPGYEMGRFIVPTAGDIECPGALLAKCEP